MKDIDATVELLVRRGLVAECDRERAREVVAEVWQDRVALVWTTRHLLEACPLLEEDEARAVLWAVLMEHDREDGVTTERLVGVAVRLYGERALEDEDDVEEEEEDE